VPQGAPKAALPALELGTGQQDLSSANLSPETPIYLDAQLWDEHGESCTDGVEVAQKLYGVGFRNLHLATGSPPERYQGLTFINSVRGKEPPWKTATD
jgi:hypothetical protein